MDESPVCVQCSAEKLEFDPNDIRIILCMNCGTKHSWSIQPIRYTITEKGKEMLEERK